MKSESPLATAVHRWLPAFLRLSLAPLAKSSAATRSCPCFTASSNGVFPNWSVRSMSTPSLTRNCTTSSYPLEAARCRGERPS
uniref:Uncharacterized protein n=1 Tax=Zea mays TaxID=4577 RepID=C4J802_MAIZE|nr:unknown [Zea mays]ACR37309.1 unknown [Zea mays]